jgi:predicted metal-dependent hydrolase
LDVLIAGIGIPVVAPWLMQAEQALDRWARRARAWVWARPDALREWWRRRRRTGAQTVVLGRAIEMSGAGRISVSGGGTGTVGRSAESEITALRQEVESLKKARAEDAADFRNQLAAQREELRAHAVSVTRQGWQYIVWGATCSAFGTFLALVA